MINANWEKIISEWIAILLVSGGIISFMYYFYEDAGINAALLGVLLIISFAAYSIIWKIEQLEKRIGEITDENYE